MNLVFYDLCSSETPGYPGLYLLDSCSVRGIYLSYFQVFSSKAKGCNITWWNFIRWKVGFMVFTNINIKTGDTRGACGSQGEKGNT